MSTLINFLNIPRKYNEDIYSKRNGAVRFGVVSMNHHLKRIVSALYKLERRLGGKTGITPNLFLVGAPALVS